MKMQITGKHLELTPAIESYAEKKINGLEKFFEGILHAGIVIGMETHHHLKGEVFFAECKMEVPGADVFAKSMGADVYAAIDMLQDELKIELKKHKEKIKGNIKRNKVVGRSVKEYDMEAEEEV